MFKQQDFTLSVKKLLEKLSSDDVVSVFPEIYKLCELVPTYFSNDNFIC